MEPECAVRGAVSCPDHTGKYRLETGTLRRRWQQENRGEAATLDNGHNQRGFYEQNYFTPVLAADLHNAPL
jgi:hypothetical protein